MDLELSGKRALVTVLDGDHAFLAHLVDGVGGVGSTPATLDAVVTAELKLWPEVIRTANIRPD